MSATNKSVRQFIDETGADRLIQEIDDSLRQLNNGKKPIYSDLIFRDEKTEYEYVNYVQEGGGVLGIALIGYTYVLEKLGFRFLRLAGTSAGAITTIMLASVDKKNYPEHDFKLQSEIMLHELLSYDLWQLVDGHWLAKRLIRIFINYRFGTSLLKFLIGCSIVIPIIYALYIIVLQQTVANLLLSPVFSVIHKIFSALALVSVITLVIQFCLFSYFRLRFDRAGFGINTGKNFHSWITEILQRNNINTLAELEQKMTERYSNIEMRAERKAQHIPGDDVSVPYPYLTLVASDITVQTKVEFPLMAPDYWVDPGSVNPADFVRASMSIPIFFEPFRVAVPQQVQNTSKLQKMKATLKDKRTSAPKISLFVDGGILSNFPINVFHNPNVRIARLPTFGVKLEDEKHISPGKEEPESRSLFKYLMTVFSTVRFYYDRDFLKRNAVYEQCIGYIDAAEYNWLNFGMDEKAKKELFIKGVQAAKTFFLGGKVWVDGKEKEVIPFEWERFKSDREKL
ncbi:patatin-like phospholipase family protein [Flavitalea sp.]|nr:patatin-like phospholipase family protein [Flavitalea sp.]